MGGGFSPYAASEVDVGQAKEEPHESQIVRNNRYRSASSPRLRRGRRRRRRRRGRRLGDRSRRNRRRRRRGHGDGHGDGVAGPTGTGTGTGSGTASSGTGTSNGVGTNGTAGSGTGANNGGSGVGGPGNPRPLYMRRITRSCRRCNSALPDIGQGVSNRARLGDCGADRPAMVTGEPTSLRLAA